MARNFSLAALLLLTPLCVPFAFAQQNDPAPQTDSESVTEPVQPDQEVEVNEDNYRQFMELKDGLQQRTIAPQDSYESRSGLQKMDQLPEASQKHLRNQLREIISEGGRWQPGDENADYPYVASEAARANAKLQKQEAEAWGELLDNYHAREAQIHANSARTRAALAGSNAAMGGGDSESGDQEENRSAQGQQGSGQSASQPGNEADSFAPGTKSGADAQNADGSEQNAMQYLQQSGQQNSTGESGAQQAGDGSETSSESSQDLMDATDAQSLTTGTGNTRSDVDEPEGVSQNALEYLSGEGTPGGDIPPDTLSIEDLLQAQGVAIGVGADSQADPQEPPDKEDKDGGG